MNVLNEYTKLTRVMTAQAAASSDFNGDVLDMAGFDGVMFIAQFGTLTVNAVTGLKAQQDSVVGFGGAADLEGTLVSFADDEDDQVLILDLVKPVEQFVRCVIERSVANAVIDSVIAIQYKAREKATTHDTATVAGDKISLSPAEGVA